MIGGPSIFHRAFFCLGACVRAFQYSLPVLCIDGTFLTGKYKGQILMAIGVDGNNQVLPIAFAFVENENTRSWYWFLEHVKDHVVGARPDVCLISDRPVFVLVLYFVSGYVGPIFSLSAALSRVVLMLTEVRRRGISSTGRSCPR